MTGIICIVAIAIGVQENHIVGPYNVSYDLGNPDQSTIRVIGTQSDVISQYGVPYDIHGLSANTSDAPLISVGILEYHQPVDFLNDDYVKGLFYINFKNSTCNALIHWPFDRYDGYLVEGSNKNGGNLYLGLYKIKQNAVVLLRSSANNLNETGNFFKTIHVEDLKNYSLENRT